jgi:ketosteroid isomerase-like protein
VTGRSPEIEDALRGWLDAKMRGDREQIVAMLSGDPAALAIGTDPDEWFEGPAEFARAHGDGAEFDGRIESLQAHSAGEVGWAAVRASVDLDGGESFPVRLTLVLVREGDGWKVVQSHASAPSPR